MFKKKQESKKGEKSGYPTQAPSYPTQGGMGYPTQQPTAPPAGAMGAPPPYTQQPPQYGQQGAGGPPPVQYQPPQGQYGGYPGQQPAYYPQAPQYGGGYPQGMPAYSYPQHPQIPPGAQVVGHGQFDAGARFNSGAGMNIPPPPPGCMPNAAQVASMHGGTVHMSQGKAGFFTTSSDGGISTHID